MKQDIFGNPKPVLIETDEWWFNGRIIQKQDHPSLPDYISFDDHRHDFRTTAHSSFKEAVQYCLENPCEKPKNLPKDYIGGK